MTPEPFSSNTYQEYASAKLATLLAIPKLEDRLTLSADVFVKCRENWGALVLLLALSELQPHQIVTSEKKPRLENPLFFSVSVCIMSWLFWMAWKMFYYEGEYATAMLFVCLGIAGLWNIDFIGNLKIIFRMLITGFTNTRTEETNRDLHS